MTLLSNKFKIICVMLIVIFAVSGCSTNEKNKDFKDYVTPISSISIPNDAVIIGIGEATHGNKEFVQIRQAVLEKLVQNYGYKVVALEGDFGGCQVVNEYILNGNGTAEDAVNQIGFAIYKTQEMVDLVEWIYNYNMSVPENEKIHFYGFDMQRYDNNKKGMLTYIQKVDSEKYEVYKTVLADLNDETVFNQPKDKVVIGLEAIEDIMEEMNKNKEQYISQSSEVEFDLAYEYANCIKQNATLRGVAKNYSTIRDKFMAEKVQWILSYEEKFGNDKIFIMGHNGHIEKSSASPMYKSMGNILEEVFKEQYYAIGTEFYESTFNCRDSKTGERKEFYLKNDKTNKLITLFNEAEIDIGFIDFDEVMNNHEYNELLTSKCKMSNIGDKFSKFYKISTKFYILKMVPSKAYDGLIFVRKATPTTMLY